MLPKPTDKDFLARFSEFKNDDADLIKLCVDDANADEYSNVKDVDKDLESLAQRIILTLAAHCLSVRLRGKGNSENLSPLTSKSGGGITLTYQKKTDESENEQFLSTQYGQEYLRLKKQLIGVPIFII